MKNNKIKHFLEFDTKKAFKTYTKLKRLIQKNKKQLQIRLNASKKDITYNNFVVPFCLDNNEIELLIAPIFHLNSVKNSKKTQKITSKCLVLLSDYHTNILQNVNVFNVLKLIQYNNKRTLTFIQNVNLEKLILEYKMQGCELEQKNKDKIKSINLQLSKLSKDFSQNILNDTNKWNMICDKNDVKQIPQNELKIFEVSSKQTKGDIQEYKFNLQAPAYSTYITYGNNRAKRETIYKAYCTRAPQNEKLIEKILNLKEKKSKLLGHKNYVEYALQTRVAKNGKKVVNFLQKLKKLSLKKAEFELAQIKKIAKQDGIKDLQSYDSAYYSQKLQVKKYKFNANKYKKYFKSDNVVDGMFLLLNRLFGIKFKQVRCVTWNKKVKVYDVYNNGKIKARLYMDLEVRKNKQGGAWMNDWQSYYSYDSLKSLDSKNTYKNTKSKTSLASAFVVCNFSPSNKNNPSLLKHYDVVTLFHEMGHAIHHIMSTTKEVDLSGVNGVAWDVVEFPSQFLELFAYDEKVLSLFARNYKNNKKLGKKDINKLIDNKNFNSSLAMLRQLEFGLFDMEIHNICNANKKNVQKTLDKIRKKTSPLHVPKYNKFQNSFSHIFGGGYASGYYSYKYAEVLSADLFMEFQKQGIFDKNLAKKYKNQILAKGSSENMNKLFEKVVQRKLNHKSILKINNIIS